MRVAFRVDASVTIGSGHVTRCATLAGALRLAGAEILFVSRDQPGNLNEYLVEQGFAVARLPDDANAPDADGSALRRPPHAGWLGVSWDEDAKQAARVIEEWGTPDWLVVDHYSLDARWEAALRSAAPRIMVIDDLADRQHDCDLLLDQNCNTDPETRYDALVPESCRKLLGPEYALLRPEFAAARERLPKRNGAVRRILVFFGGSDPGNATRVAVEALLSLDRAEFQADVVVGAANPRRGEIEQLCSGRAALRFHCQVPHMSELMAGADLAIGAGGVALLERCALALPSIIIAIADNQRTASRALAERGGAICLGDASEVSVEQLASAVGLLLQAPELVRHMGLMAGAITDARGCDRVLATLLPRRVSLRLATPDDCENVWRWRNDATVRRYSASSDSIELPEHRRWYADVLDDPNRVLLIGENGDGAVGVLRYDLAARSATISVYLVPGRQGRGFGTDLIWEGEAWLRQHRPDVARIIAEIDARNAASVRAFTNAGFEANRLVYVRDIPGG